MVVGLFAMPTVSVDNGSMAQLAIVRMLTFIHEVVIGEDLSLSTSTDYFLERVLTGFTGNWLAHDVKVFGFVEEGSALLLRADEKVIGILAIGALNELAEFRLRDKDSFFRIAAARTLSKSPINFAAILKADVSEKSPSSFDGILGCSLTARTENIMEDVRSLGLLRHGAEGL